MTELLADLDGVPVQDPDVVMEGETVFEELPDGDLVNVTVTEFDEDALEELDIDGVNEGVNEGLKEGEKETDKDGVPEIVEETLGDSLSCSSIIASYDA